jgi:hypothetical protein
MAVDSPSVNVPLCDLMLTHLVVALMTGSAKTGSYYVVGGSYNSAEKFCNVIAYIANGIVGPVTNRIGMYNKGRWKKRSRKVMS